VALINRAIGAIPVAPVPNALPAEPVINALPAVPLATVDLPTLQSNQAILMVPLPTLEQSETNSITNVVPVTEIAVKSENTGSEIKWSLSLFEWMAIAEKQNYCCACECGHILGPNAVVTGSNSGVIQFASLLIYTANCCDRLQLNQIVLFCVSIP